MRLTFSLPLPVDTFLVYVYGIRPFTALHPSSCRYVPSLLATSSFPLVVSYSSSVCAHLLRSHYTFTPFPTRFQSVVAADQSKRHQIANLSLLRWILQMVSSRSTGYRLETDCTCMYAYITCFSNPERMHHGNTAPVCNLRLGSTGHLRDLCETNADWHLAEEDI